jgi:hypothetical protein
MPGRNLRQLKERWNLCLSVTSKSKFTLTNNAPFTFEENNLLVQKVVEFGPKWTMITGFFTGRSISQIKNQYQRLKARSLPLVSPISAITPQSLWEFDSPLEKLMPQQPDDNFDELLPKWLFNDDSF